MRLANKVALITGSANGALDDVKGIGGATAWMFAKEGAKVVLADINDEMGQKTALQLRNMGYDSIYVHLNVSNEQNWIKAINKAVLTYGKLDILVNSAGTIAPFSVEDTTSEVWDEQMNVHAKGTFLGTKHAIPAMRKSGGGSIINMSSINGLVAATTSTAYCAAKGAVRVFSKASAVQYAKENIRVNSVHPGYTKTPLNSSASKIPAGISPEEIKRRIMTVPLGRMATSDEIAYGILFLASNESSFITGSELVIDGGVTAQ